MCACMHACGYVCRSPRRGTFLFLNLKLRSQNSVLIKFASRNNEGLISNFFLFNKLSTSPSREDV